MEKSNNCHNKILRGKINPNSKDFISKMNISEQNSRIDELKVQYQKNRNFQTEEQRGVLGFVNICFSEAIFVLIMNVQNFGDNMRTCCYLCES